MANPINRRLTYQDEGQQWQFIEQHDIAGIAKPVVILGGPGMGENHPHQVARHSSRHEVLRRRQVQTG